LATKQGSPRRSIIAAAQAKILTRYFPCPLDWGSWVYATQWNSAAKNGHSGHCAVPENAFSRGFPLLWDSL